MKTRLTFWTIYLFAIVFMYLGSFPETIKKSDVGITQSTIYLIKQFEGIRHSAYDDGFGNMTIGVGHLIKASEPHLHYTTLKMHEIQHLLKRDLEPCEAFLRAGVGTPLNQPQFDALMSVCFNIGLDKFKDSKIVRYLNQGDIQKAGDAILNWNKPSVLEARRKQERKLFLSKI